MTLLQRVIDDPEDVQARLVLADALIDQGDPRGEFIALQCRLDTRDALDPAWPAEHAASARLRRKHLAKWTAALHSCGIFRAHSLNSHNSLVFAFRRGFIERLTFEASHISHIGWARSLFPLRKVKIAGSGADVPTLLPLLKGIPHLELYGAFKADQLVHLLQPLVKITHLSLLESGLGARGTKRLAAALPGSLRSLEVHAGAVGSSGLAALMKLEATPELRGLALTANSFAAAVLPTLLDAPLERLEHLSLSHHGKFAGVLGPLVAWSRLSKLKSLDLRASYNASDLRALACAAIPALERLSLASIKGKWRQSDAEQIARMPFRRLTHLNLSNLRMGDDGLVAFLRNPNLGSLVQLNLSGNSLTEVGVAALLDAPLHRLVHLNFANNRLTDAAAEMLAGSPKLQHLTHLDLSNNRRIRVPGVAHLIDSDLNLATLNLDGLDMGIPDDPMKLRVWQRFGTAAFFHAAGWEPPS